MYITLTGKCPVQNKPFSVSVKLFDESSKFIGRVECDFVRHGGDCNQSQCPIVKQNGYHH